MTIPRHPLLERTAYRLVRDAAAMAEIEALRYRAYFGAGLVPENPERRISDRYDRAPNAFVFAIDLDGRLAATVRMAVLSEAQPVGFTPDLFGDVILPRLACGEIFVDSSRFAVDPDIDRLPELPLLALRLNFILGARFGAHTSLAAVREHHMGFYRRVFGGVPIAAPRQFPGGIPLIGLLAADLDASRERAERLFPVVRSDAAEREALFGGWSEAAE